MLPRYFSFVGANTGHGAGCLPGQNDKKRMATDQKRLELSTLMFSRFARISGSVVAGGGDDIVNLK